MCQGRVRPAHTDTRHGGDYRPPGLIFSRALAAVSDPSSSGVLRNRHLSPLGNATESSAPAGLQQRGGRRGSIRLSLRVGGAGGGRVVVASQAVCARLSQEYLTATP